MCKVLGCYTQLVGECGNVIPHCANVVHIVSICDKDVMSSNYIMYALASPVPPQGYLPMVIDWISTTGIVSSQVSHDLHMIHSPPLVGRAILKAMRLRCLSSLFPRGPYV